MSAPETYGETYGVADSPASVEVIQGHLVSATTQPRLIVVRLVRDDATEVHLPLCPDLAARLGECLTEWGRTR